MSDEPTRTEFAELLYEWMGKQRPLSNPNKLARTIGVHPQTVYTWLAGGRPSLALLMTVASKTGIPLPRLAAAAGYPIAPDPDDVFRSLLDELDERPDFDDGERAKVRRFIEDLRARSSHPPSQPPSQSSGGPLALMVGHAQTA